MLYYETIGSSTGELGDCASKSEVFFSDIGFPKILSNKPDFILPFLCEKNKPRTVAIITEIQQDDKIIIIIAGELMMNINYLL